jgi:hypothetical protein
MDLNNMIFPAKTNLVFGSWIYEANGDSKLHSRLLIDSGLHGGLANSTTAVNQLAEEFSQLAMSELTQISWVIDSNSDSASASDSKSNQSSFHDKPSSFPMGL